LREVIIYVPVDVAVIKSYIFEINLAVGNTGILSLIFSEESSQYHATSSTFGLQFAFCHATCGFRDLFCGLWLVACGLEGFGGKEDTKVMSRPFVFLGASPKKGT
jgi:hypothetical protein